MTEEQADYAINHALARELGEMFERTVAEEYDSKVFVEAYMKSSTAEHFDRPWDMVQGLGSAYLLETFEDEAGDALTKSGDVCDPDFLYWLGYQYAWWQRVFEDSSARILQMAPFDDMLFGYPALHCMDPTMVATNFRERAGIQEPPEELRDLLAWDDQRTEAQE